MSYTLLRSPLLCAAAPLLIASALALLPGCESGDAAAKRTASTSVSQQPSASARPEDSGKPAAMVDGQPVEWSTLRPLLAEASGGAILQEVILDRRLDKLMADQGVTLDGGEQAAMARERALYVRALSQNDRPRPGSPPVTPDEAEILLANIRRTRGLGELRFNALLLRSAKLRAMVRDQIQIDDASLDQAIKIRYGPKHRCRIIVTATSMEAAAARQRIIDATGAGSGLPVVGALSAAFTVEALQSSIDSSARPAGGLIESFSVSDLSYPGPLRQVAAQLQPGALSPVIALDRNYALLLVEYIEPASPEITSGSLASPLRDEVERDLRARLERTRMDSFVSRALATGGITVLDRSLGFSYENLAKPK